MDFSITINWTSLFPSLGVPGVLFYFTFDRKSCYANTVGPDQTSDLGLHCLPMSSKSDARHKRVKSITEPSHEIMARFVFRKLILQTRMRGHPVGLDVPFLVGPFFYFHTSCVRTAKALARLGGCAGSPEPSLVAYVISTTIS